MKNRWDGKFKDKEGGNSEQGHRALECVFLDATGEERVRWFGCCITRDA